jgi:hypothetical protein
LKNEKDQISFLSHLLGGNKKKTFKSNIPPQTVRWQKGTLKGNMTRKREKIQLWRVSPLMPSKEQARLGSPGTAAGSDSNELSTELHV